MEDLLNQILQSTNEIPKTISEISTVLGKPNWIEILLTVGLTSVFAILGTLLGTKKGAQFAQNNEKEKIEWNSLISYFEIVNTYYYEIKSIIIDIEDLSKIPAYILNEIDEEVECKNYNDFHLIKEDIQALRQTIQELVIKESKDGSDYKQSYINKADRILNFDLFGRINADYKIKSSCYYPFISQKLIETGETFYNELEIARKNLMINFNIYDFEKRLSSYVEEIKIEIEKLKTIR